MLTQKEDKRNHGFGTRNVKDCITKNGGTVNFEYTETKFIATVTLINAVQKIDFDAEKTKFYGKNVTHRKNATAYRRTIGKRLGLCQVENTGYEQGNLLSSYAYNAFGELVTSADFTPEQSQNITRFLYAGEQYDEIPNELKIIQRENNAGHFEIVPANGTLNQIKSIGPY